MAPSRDLVLPALCLVLLALPRAAQAEESAKEEAQAIFLTAQSHYQQGRYTRALAELKRAYAIKKMSVFLRYMGDCNMKLARFNEALTLYTRYLSKMPDAKGRDQIEAKMGVARERLRAQRKEEYVGKKVPVALMPTGKDQEDPVIKMQKKDQAELPKEYQVKDRGTYQEDDFARSLRVAKWTTGGLGLVAMALGVTFNRLAAARSDKLLRTVQSACPPNTAGICIGNPALDRPVVEYSKEHLQLELEVDQYNDIAVASFVVGGAAAAASVTLFILHWLDKRGTGGSRHKVTITPQLDSRSAGLLGEVTF